MQNGRTKFDPATMKGGQVSKVLLYGGLILLGALLSGTIKSLPVIGSLLSKVGG